VLSKNSNEASSCGFSKVVSQNGAEFLSGANRAGFGKIGELGLEVHAFVLMNDHVEVRGGGARSESA
jgi:hypothetical protein